MSCKVFLSLVQIPLIINDAFFIPSIISDMHDNTHIAVTRFRGMDLKWQSEYLKGVFHKL